ncbi:transcription factor AP-4-like [Corticium candelabrum]|uniref:transcription factor AP-4-like n=1 Tax=Corticium candelabrum TaxID=121492 RepID=UPI002E2594A9|nr:transcription factor AP-4-like [Corticium candelabrum]
MQSINSGFRALKMLLPQADGEKMSKAAILQHAAEHIYALQQEKARTAHQTAHLTWLLASMQESTAALQQQQQQRQLSDQRVSPPTDHPTASLAVSLAETHQELAHLRIELERERRVRANVEKRLSSLTSSFQSAPPDSNSSPAEKDTPMGDDSDTPRGTLDTIVRAIRHLEGDRVFTPVPDEESS